MERLTFAATGKVEGHTLSGVAHTYGTVTADSRKRRFAAGAFTRSIAAGGVLSFAWHSDSISNVSLLGSQKAGTLRLSDGADGLGFELDLPETSYGNDLRALAARGEPIGMSFTIAQGGKAVRSKDGITTYTDVRLLSVDPVALPAFEGTDVILNSADHEGENARAQAVRIRARTLSRFLLP